MIDYEKRLQLSIDDYYENTVKNIQNEITKVYNNFSIDGKLTLEIMQRFGRLLKLEKQIQKEINNLSGKQFDALLINLGNLYQESYLYTGFTIEKEVMEDLTYKLIPKKQVEKAILMDIGDLTIKARNDLIRKEMFWTVKESLTKGFLNGDDIKTMSKRVNERLDIGKSKSTRIVQTEANRLRNAGTNESYKQAESKGIKFKKMWVSTVDFKTRDTHKHLDGQFADEKGFFHSGRFKAQVPGNFGVPEEDINCRCTTIAKFDNIGTEKRKENVKTNGEKKIVEYKNYEDWYNSKIKK